MINNKFILNIWSQLKINLNLIIKIFKLMTCMRPLIKKIIDFNSRVNRWPPINKTKKLFIILVNKTINFIKISVTINNINRIKFRNYYMYNKYKMTKCHQIKTIKTKVTKIYNKMSFKW